MKIYNSFLKALGDGNVSFANDTIRVMAVAETYTFDMDHRTLADVDPATHEVTGTNYARIDIAGKTSTQDDLNDLAKFDGESISWTAIDTNEKIKGLVVYRHVSDDTDGIPLLFVDSGGFPINTNGADLTIDWNTAGIFRIRRKEVA